jgi:CheY-like chemotaxis protein
MERDGKAGYAGVYIARKCCQALRQIVILRAEGEQHALVSVRKLVDEANAALGEDAQAAGFLAAVLSYAGDLFSTAGSAKWARPRMAGSSYLKLQILAKLSLFYHRLSELEAECLGTDADRAGVTGAPQAGLGYRLRILVADDEPDTVQTIKFVLEHEGHEVVGVYDGGELLREARKRRPDAVILDIGMPGLTGYDVARALRALYGPKNPVLIAVTAYAAPSDKLIGRDAGFDHHFGKPVLIDHLLAALPRASQPPGNRA